MSEEVKHLSEIENKKKVLYSYGRMTLLGIAIIFLAVLTASILNTAFPMPKVYIKVCEYIGYVGWSSTLGALGWEIHTRSGNSSPERLNKNLANLFAMVGIFAFVLARELIPAAY
jgi:hypothetical protein